MRILERGSFQENSEGDGGGGEEEARGEELVVYFLLTAKQIFNLTSLDNHNIDVNNFSE